MKKKHLAGIAALAIAGTTLAGIAGATDDFGLRQQHQVESHANEQFGVTQPLTSSSTASISAADATSDPTKLVTLAKGLSARVVTTTSGANTDMIALWPSETNPTWLVACNEQDATKPGLQRIRLSDGHVDTIVTGTTSCDGVRRTAWGTILFDEEAGTSGAVYELLDPVGTTGVSLDRTTGVFSGGTGATNLVRRDALGRLSFEGLGVYANGVTYYGDENRSSQGKPAGAYFKFVPTTPWTGSAPITSLAQSPLAAGKVYGLRVSKAGANDFGQGMNTGDGQWIDVDAGKADLRVASQTSPTVLTGYYRPEDIDIDRAAEAAGHVRWCANNTGREENHTYGEAMCVTDGSLADATATTSTPQVQALVEGNPELAMMDNMAYQPGRGNWLLHEDGETDFERPHDNDIWSCLDDGADTDLLSDGCIRIATLNDLTAEWTGGVFDATGTHFYVSVQHNVTGSGVVLDITGWK